MNVTLIHGQTHRGSTWHFAQEVLARLPAAKTEEWYLPKDGPGFCTGCNACFLKGEEACKDAAAMAQLHDSIVRADVLIVDSPCYVLNMSGQLKTFFDHMGYRFMVHRPHPAMFGKVGICLSTAAGGGAGRATKEMARNLFFWGVPRVLRGGCNVAAATWDDVKPEIQAKIARKAARLAKQAVHAAGRTKPGLKTRFFFSVMRGMQTAAWANPADRAHWQRQGWLGATRPWKPTPRA